MIILRMAICIPLFLLLFFFNESFSFPHFAEQKSENTDEKSSDEESEQTDENISEEEDFSLEDFDEEEDEEASNKNRFEGVKERFHVSVLTGLNLEMNLGHTDNQQVSFSSNHNYFLLSISPSPLVNFTAEISENIYWDFLWRFGKKTGLHLGKLAVPFGKLPFHNLYGGVVERPLQNGEGISLLIPRDWTEYGLQLDISLLDFTQYALQSKFWITNGMRGFDIDTVMQTINFTIGGGDDWDNNYDKALGFRFDNTFFSGRYQLGISYYTAKWSDFKPGEKWFFSGDRVTLFNIDARLDYNAIPIPILRNLRVTGGIAFLQSRSTQTDEFDPDILLHIPWFTKTADYLDFNLKTFSDKFILITRMGRYDDNTSVTNTNDYSHLVFGFSFKPIPYLNFISRYFILREKGAQISNDYAMIQAVITM